MIPGIWIAVNREPRRQSGPGDVDDRTDVNDILAIKGGSDVTHDVDDLLNTIADDGCCGRADVADGPPALSTFDSLRAF
jgi:hypothetical protein